MKSHEKYVFSDRVEIATGATLEGLISFGNPPFLNSELPELVTHLWIGLAQVFRRHQFMLYFEN